MTKCLRRSILLVILAMLLSSLSSFQANARWAKENEANIECLNSETLYKVNKDGSWTMDFDIQLKILNEAGRQALSTLTYTYNAALCTLDVIEAKTSSNGREIIVPKDKIEDKPLASDPLGLQKEHQILIPFERVTVGSIVHVKLKKKLFNPQFKNYFSLFVTAGANYVEKKGKITIESELPLFVKSNDPRHSLAITESKNKAKHTVQIDLKKPIFEALFDETEDSYGEHELFTSVSISTEKDYERIGKLTANLYQSLLISSLPEELQKIRDVASKIKDETDCIDTVVAYLIERISYLGSWNTAEGLMAPRSLEAIITSGYGDCKEYSACLSAILNSLGYQAKIALVKRSNVYLDDNNLPNLEKFNHAIVKVISPSGKTYWIDPTNLVSMAKGIFPDIADRPALVLDPEHPTYEHIPPIDYRRAISNYREMITIKDDGYVGTEGSFSLEGETAKDYVEYLNMHHISTVKEGLIKKLCKSSDPINPALTLSECTTCKVIPVNATFSYGEKNILTHTNLGKAFPLKGNWHKPYIVTSQKDEGALYVGYPQTVVKEKIFKNVSAENLEQLAFSIQTPWLNAKRELSVTKEGIIVTETIEILKSIISAKDLKSKEFAKLKDTLRNYCEGGSIVFSK